MARKNAAMKLRADTFVCGQVCSKLFFAYVSGRLQLLMSVAGYNYLYLWQAMTIIGVTNIRLMHNFTKRATVILHQRKIHADFVNAAGGHVKWLPPGAIFPQKCGRWHFENAVGRENPAKPRPLDSISGLHRPRSRMTVSARLFLCLHKWMRKWIARHK